MQQIDSQYQYDHQDWATYEAARVQADAAIRAAEIGAQAAKDAAEIGAKAISEAATLQFWVAVIAAFAVLIAGRWAYRAAITAAERQTQLENDKHKARVTAYKIRQKSLVDNFINVTKINISEISARIKDLEKNKKVNGRNYTSHDKNIYDDDVYIDIIPNEEPDDWKDEKWENHAILGEDFVELLVSIKQVHRAVKSFENYIIAFNEKVGSDSSNTYLLRDKWIDDLSSLSEGNEKNKSAFFEFSNSLDDLNKYVKYYLTLEALLLRLLMVLEK